MVFEYSFVRFVYFSRLNGLEFLSFTLSSMYDRLRLCPLLSPYVVFVFEHDAVFYDFAV